MTLYHHVTYHRSNSGLVLASRALRVPQVRQPCAAVEFSIHALDLALAVDVEVVDALHRFRIVAGTLLRDPAPADGVAAPEIIQRLENERRLLAGLVDEILLAGESHRTFLYGEPCQQCLIDMLKRAKPSRLTGLPASWLMESEVSVKSLENNALAVAAKLEAWGLKLFDVVSNCLENFEGILHPRCYLLGQQVVEGIDDVLGLERKEA